MVAEWWGEGGTRRLSEGRLAHKERKKLSKRFRGCEVVMVAWG